MSFPVTIRANQHEGREKERLKFTFDRVQEVKDQQVLAKKRLAQIEDKVEAFKERKLNQEYNLQQLWQNNYRSLPNYRSNYYKSRNMPYGRGYMRVPMGFLSSRRGTLGQRVLARYRRSHGHTPYYRMAYQQMYNRPYRGGIKYATRRQANARSGGSFGHEVKFLDLACSDVPIVQSDTIAGAAISPESPANIGCLNAPPRDTSASGRIGHEICLKSLIIKYAIRATPSVDPAAFLDKPIVNLAVILDTQTNGDPINTSLLWKNLAGNAAGSMCALRDMSNTHRYRILKRKTVRMSVTDYSNTTKDVGANEYLGQFNLNLRNLCTTFAVDTTTASYTNIKDNSIHLIAWKNNGWVLDISYNARLRFMG